MSQITLVLSVAALCTAAVVVKDIDIRAWPVPWAGSRPRDPYADGQGRVWFVGQRGNDVAYLEPASGRFHRYELEDGALPHNLIVSRSGAIWYSGNGNGSIGRLDPATGQVRVFRLQTRRRATHIRWWRRRTAISGSRCRAGTSLDG